MSEKIKVSVVVAVYNVKPYLNQCLDSLCGQTLKEIEIICVNDGSTDGSVEILEEYRKKDSRVQVITQENKGLSEARNIGVSYVTGDYIYFVDSDDWLELGALEKLYEVAKENNVEILYFSGTVFFDTNDITAEDINLKRTSCTGQVLTGNELFELWMQRSEFIPFIWLQFFDTSYYRANNCLFYPDIYYEDNLFTFQSIFTAKRTYCIEDILYHYRKRDGSITRTISSTKSIESYVTVFLSCLLTLKTQKLPKEKEILYRHFFDEIRKYIVYNYGAVYDEKRSYVEEIFLNLEKILFSEKVSTMLNRAEFSLIRNQFPQLCFFGAGYYCQWLLDLFNDYDIAHPIAICDNKKESHGTLVRNIPIISFEEALCSYENLVILISNQNHYQEILQQVTQELSADKILKLDI